jgi:hypothetical protein
MPTHQEYHAVEIWHPSHLREIELSLKQKTVAFEDRYNKSLEVGSKIQNGKKKKKKNFENFKIQISPENCHSILS